jgi:hypothetical protein
MTRTVLALAIMFSASVSAQHGGGSHATAPHGSPAPKPTTPHATGAPKTTGSHAHASPKTTAPHGHASSPKTTPHGSAPATSAHASKKTTSGSTITSTTLTPVQQKLQRNTNLASKLQSRLPAGTNLQLAAAGFRNLGQFVAAVNVSNNLGIPFAQLKTRMVDQGMSLGQAIQDARPSTTNTTLVASRAERDADDQIRATEQTTTKKHGGHQ